MVHCFHSGRAVLLLYNIVVFFISNKSEVRLPVVEEQKEWSVYLIKTRLDTLYTGATTDVERRFQEHVSGKQKSARYLRGKDPLTLVWQQVVGDKKSALSIEYKIKQLKRKSKLALISGSITLETLFSNQ